MKYLYLFFCLVLLFPACSIEDRIERREDRLLGSWIIEKASYKDYNRLFSDNVTEDFENDVITFFANYTLVYEAGNGQTFEGVWYIDAFIDRADDTEFTLDADFFNFRGDLAFRWVGTIDRLNDNNFNLTIPETGGTLRLRWDKL